MRPVFFCWEQTTFGHWAPVCYHGEKPRPERVSEGDSPRRSPVHVAPADCIDEDGSPNFGRLKARFPLAAGMTR